MLMACPAEVVHRLSLSPEVMVVLLGGPERSLGHTHSPMLRRSLTTLPVFLPLSSQRLGFCDLVAGHLRVE